MSIFSILFFFFFSGVVVDIYARFDVIVSIKLAKYQSTIEIC